MVNPKALFERQNPKNALMGFAGIERWLLVRTPTAAERYRSLNRTSMLRRFALFACLFVLQLLGCKKTDTSLGCATGKKLSFAYEYASPVQYATPRFNPLNANEIIYIRFTTNVNSELVKYDLKRKEQLVVAQGIWNQRPDWSRAGWILFYHTDGSLWKIKGDGNSALKLVSQFSANAIWNWSGNQIAYSGDAYALLVDSSGKFIDSLPISIVSAAWSPDDTKIVTQRQFGTLCYVDLKNMAVHDLVTGEESSFYGADWFPDGNSVVFCSDNGIFRIDVNTGQKQRLQEGCATKIYEWPSVSPDGSKILVERVDGKIVNDTFYSEPGLFMMDANGANETKVEVP